LRKPRAVGLSYRTTAPDGAPLDVLGIVPFAYTATNFDESGAQGRMRAVCEVSFRRADRGAHRPEFRHYRGDAVLVGDAE
jgi:hypothetical protein